MSVLSDGDLRRAIAAGEIGVDPFNDEDIQPASIDLHLDKSFRVFRNNRYGFIDPSVDQPGLTELEVVSGAEPFMLHTSILRMLELSRAGSIPTKVGSTVTGSVPKAVKLKFGVMDCKHAVSCTLMIV
mgnify:CR=1 FL=1